MLFRSIYFLAHYTFNKNREAYQYALEQKTVLMGNNVEVVRKGTHEPESETKQSLRFSSGWF